MTVAIVKKKTTIAANRGRVTQARCEAITLIFVSTQDRCLGMVPAWPGQQSPRVSYG